MGKWWKFGKEAMYRPASDRAEVLVTMDVDVVIEDERWVALDGLARTAVPAALSGAGLQGDYEVVIMGCNDARIAVLNADFRGKPTPTNVLSWPSEDRTPGEPFDETELGDIAISFDTCAREAAEQSKPFDAHVIHLLIHATLHLLGYDHISDEQAERMEALEVQILEGLGFPDPYHSAMG